MAAAEPAVGRLDGPDKVFGRAVYGPDLARVGMLHGRLLRSPVPHGRIVSSVSRRESIARSSCS